MLESIARCIWNDEKIAELRRLWADGLSAAKIAKEMGGISRNAVLSKIHRLGAAKREKGWQRSPNGVRRPKPSGNYYRLPKKVKPAPKAAPPLAMEFVGLDLFELRPGQCRFPRGDQAPYLFCGQPTREDSSYCPYCHFMTHRLARSDIELLEVA